MRLLTITTLLTMAVTVSFFCSTAEAQDPPDQARMSAIQSRLNVTKLAISRLPEPLQRRLSGAALNMLQFAERWDDFRPPYGEDSEHQAKLSQLRNAGAHPFKPEALSNSGRVSDPFLDFLFSVMSGFTQSETSTAWCGSTVVVGFNDSGSLYQSFLIGPGGLSFSGASTSIDGGQFFRDIGYINPGPDQATFLAGDPVLNCTDSNTFYYSQIGAGGTTFPTSNVFVSKSTDGGSSWADPVSAVAKDGFLHSLDKDWSAIDPNDPKRMYVTYTDFDFSGSVCSSSGLPIPKIAIEIVQSSDAGVSWSQPTVIDEVCSPAPVFPFVQGSQVAVDSHGNVFVGWEYYPEGGLESIRELRIAKSTDHGSTFEGSHKISDVVPSGDGIALQGGFRDGIGGNLGIDTSGRCSDGHLYMIWDDGRVFSRPDIESPTGRYHYANVLVTHSEDGGKSWSQPV